MSSRKSLTDHKPQKLTEFAYKLAGWKNQDGAGQAAPSSAYTDLPDDMTGEQPDTGTVDNLSHAPDGDPLLGSPAKARMRLDALPQRSHHPQTEAQAPIPYSLDQALHSSMSSFPISGQPVMDTTLKEMLISLQTSLMTDLSSLFHKITTDIHTLDDRMTNAERGIYACTSTVNDTIEAYEVVKEEQAWMRAN